MWLLKRVVRLSVGNVLQDALRWLTLKIGRSASVMPAIGHYMALSRENVAQKVSKPFRLLMKLCARKRLGFFRYFYCNVTLKSNDSLKVQSCVMFVSAQESNVHCVGTFPVLFINSSRLSSLAMPGLGAPLSSYLEGALYKLIYR